MSVPVPGRSRETPVGTLAPFTEPYSSGVSVWLFWGLGLTLLVPIWMGLHFPSEDGLAHLAWTEAYRSLALPDAPWRIFYVRSVEWNTPNLAYFGLQYALGTVLEPHLAQRVIISALIVTWVASVHLLSAVVMGRITLGALASLLLIHSSWLYGGYLSFLLGIPLLLLGPALIAMRQRAPGEGVRLSDVALSLLGIVAYYCHLVVAAVFLLLVALAGVLQRRQRTQLRGLAVAAGPTVFLVASYLTAGSLGSGGLRWEPITKTVARFAGFAFFRGFAAPGPTFWFALALFATIVLALCIEAARTLWRGGTLGANRLIIVLAACLGLFYFTAPEGIGDGYNLKGRFQLVLWAWLLPCLPCAFPRRARVLKLVAVSLLLLWQVADFSSRARRFNRAYDATIARASAIPPGSTIERELDYDHAAFEGSFIRVLAHAPEDLAFHCGCVLVGGYHPSTAFYWVGTRSVRVHPPYYRLQIRQLAGQGVTFSLERVADRDGGERVDTETGAALSAHDPAAVSAGTGLSSTSNSPSSR